VTLSSTPAEASLVAPNGIPCRRQVRPLPLSGVVGDPPPAQSVTRLVSADSAQHCPIAARSKRHSDGAANGANHHVLRGCSPGRASTQRGRALRTTLLTPQSRSVSSALAATANRRTFFGFAAFKTRSLTMRGPLSQGMRYARPPMVFKRRQALGVPARCSLGTAVAVGCLFRIASSISVALERALIGYASLKKASPLVRQDRSARFRARALPGGHGTWLP